LFSQLPLLYIKKQKKAIGYRETIAFIKENKSDLSELQKEIQANTIALVRKQRKFFRNNLK
jgi:tRNA A37 N6-isopentenylltransferase MiaA